MNSFIEILNIRGGQFVRFAWPMWWQSSVLITFLFALDFALRKKVRATVRYVLWMLVLVKLLLPASLSLPTSVGYWVPTPDSVAMEEATSAPLLAKFQSQPALAPAKAAPLPRAVPVIPAPIPLLALSWPGIAAAIWVCGTVVLFLVFLLRARQAHRIAARAATTSEYAELLSDCARMMGVRTDISLKLSEAVATPAVCGLFHSVILLPKSLAGTLAKPQLRAVLLHEMAHVRRRDLWVGHLQTALQIFYFYNPLFWLANVAIRRAREEAVDEMVLVAMADDAASYPETLLDVAKYSLQAPRLAFGFAGILESKSTLGARIRLMLQRPWPTSAKLGLPAAAAIVILALVLLPMSNARQMPSYQGKTAQQWFGQIELSHDLNDKGISEGVYAFKQMGKEAVPFLRKTLAQTNAAATGTGGQSIVPGSGRGRPRKTEAQERAAFVLEQLGPIAAPAIPELRAALSGGGYGEITFRAAAALGAIGPAARPAVPALFTALRSGNCFAGQALAKIDPDNPALVPALIEVVQSRPAGIDSQPAVEAAAVEAVVALKSLGPKAIAAVPALRQMLAQTNGATLPADPRFFAALALQKIAPDQPELAAEIKAALHPPTGPLPDVNQLLENAERAAPTGRGSGSIGDALYQLAMAVGTKRFSGSPVPDSMIRDKILPLFDRALDGSDTAEFGPVFGGLCALGPAAAPLLPKVIVILATNDSTARLNGICSLSQIAPGNMTTLPTFIRLLDDVNDSVKQNACAGLSHFGPEAMAAVPGLHRCLKAPSMWVQFNAAVALWRIAKEPPSIALLKTAVSEDDNGDYVPSRTLEMLGGLSAQTDETKSIIRQFARASSDEVRTNALALLDKIGETRSFP